MQHLFLLYTIILIILDYWIKMIWLIFLVLKKTKCVLEILKQNLNNRIHRHEKKNYDLWPQSIIFALGSRNIIPPHLRKRKWILFKMRMKNDVLLICTQKKTVNQDYHKEVNNINKFNIVILSKINLFRLFFLKAMFEYSRVLLIYILI